MYAVSHLSPLLPFSAGIRPEELKSTGVPALTELLSPTTFTADPPPVFPDPEARDPDECDSPLPELDELMEDPVLPAAAEKESRFPEPRFSLQGR